MDFITNANEVQWDKITAIEDELKAERENGVLERPVNSFTRGEFAAKFSLPLNRATERLQKLKEAGKLRIVRFRVRRANGVIQITDGYQIIDDASSNDGERRAK